VASGGWLRRTADDVVQGVAPVPRTSPSGQSQAMNKQQCVPHERLMAVKYTHFIDDVQRTQEGEFLNALNTVETLFDVVCPAISASSPREAMPNLK
jgi:hypothetical protein